MKPGDLPTRGDVGRAEATRDPVFLLRYRHRGDKPDRNRWHVDSVWFTRQEAEEFGHNHAHAIQQTATRIMKEAARD